MHLQIEHAREMNALDGERKGGSTWVTCEVVKGRIRQLEAVIVDHGQLQDK